MGRQLNNLSGVSLVSTTALLTFCFWAAPAWAAPTVVISELMWDGTEYVELFNSTSADISVSGWQLTRQQNGKGEVVVVTFDDSDVIGTGEYFLIEKKEDATTVTAHKLVSGLTLVNTGELVRLKDSSGDVVDSANQLDDWFAGSNTDEGEAMERSDFSADGEEEESWHTSTGEVGGRVGTPGQMNTVKPVNQAPQATVSVDSGEADVGQVVTLSAEDSSDADGDELTYSWDFGDGSAGSGSVVTHAFTSAGDKNVQLTVSDGEENDTAAVTITVLAVAYSGDLVINEFLPDPTGSDTDNEFIEIFNSGGATVDLTDWQVDDAEGGSTPYTIPSGFSVSASGYMSFTRAVTKIALNNDGDSVRILSPDGVVQHSTSYEDSGEGLSWNRTESGNYAESTTLTAGAKNVITPPATEEEEEEESATPTPRRSASSAGLVAGTATKTVALKNIRAEAKGTVVTTEGVVSSPPGVLGQGVLYLAGSGVQVYFSGDDYPEVDVGDTVSVTGEISSYLGETRVKLAAVTDMTVKGTGEVPLPHEAKTGDVNESFEGFLVVIVGKVTETSGDTFYVDDGSGEVKVFIKESTGIEKPKMKKGDVVTITGVVSQTTSGYRILPRFQEDVRLGAVAGLKTFPATGLRGDYGRQAGPELPGRVIVLALAALWLPAFTWRSTVAT